MHLPKNLIIVLAIGMTVFLWASAFVAIRVGLASYSPGSLALLRFVAASLVLLLLNLRRGMRLPMRRDFPAIALAGLLGISLYNLALNYGEVSVSAGTASFVVNFGPIFTALLALWLLQERLQLWGWLGIGISFSGVTLIAVSQMAGRFELASGVALVLGAALLQSLYFVMQKPLLQKYKPLELTSYVVWVGTFFLLIFTPTLLGEVSSAPFDGTLAVIYLGVFPGALAYITWAIALSHLPAAKAASFLYFVPVITTLIAWLWLNEQPHPLALLGGGIVLTGVIVVSRFGKAQPRPPG